VIYATGFSREGLRSGFRLVATCGQRFLLTARSTGTFAARRSAELASFDYCFFLPEKARPKKTAANTKKTTPIPESSRVKSTIAIMRNKTPARALPSACLDIPRLYPLRASFRKTLVGQIGETRLGDPLGREFEQLTFDVVGHFSHLGRFA
jgi:hypothetical protein